MVRIILAALVISVAIGAASWRFWPSSSETGQNDAGHGPGEIAVRDAGEDKDAEVIWREFKVQGVSVLIPGSSDGSWRSNLNTDICHPLKAQYFVVEHVQTGTRFRVDLATSEVRFSADSKPTELERKVVDEISGSFAGEFTGDERLNGVAQPTPTDACDKMEDVPELAPEFEPPAAQSTEEVPVEDPTATPATPPTPEGIREGGAQ